MTVYTYSVADPEGGGGEEAAGTSLNLIDYVFFFSFSHFVQNASKEGSDR